MRAIIAAGILSLAISAVSLADVTGSVTPPGGGGAANLGTATGQLPGYGALPNANQGTIIGSSGCSGSQAPPLAVTNPCISGALTTQQSITAPGIVPDCSTDNTIAAQAAINANETALAQGAGYKLVWPAGCIVTQPLAISPQLNMEGAANFGTVFKLASGFNAAIFTVAATGTLNFPNVGYPDAKMRISNIRCTSADGKTGQSTEPLAHCLNFNWEAQATFSGALSGTALTITGLTGTLNAGIPIFGVGVPVGTVLVSGSGSSWVTNRAPSSSISAESMTAGSSLVYWAYVDHVDSFAMPGNGVNGLGCLGTLYLDQFEAHQNGGLGVGQNSTCDWESTDVALSFNGLGGWTSSGDAHVQIHHPQMYFNSGHGLHIFGNTTMTVDGHGVVEDSQDANVFVDTLGSNGRVNFTDFWPSAASQGTAATYPDILISGGAGLVNFVQTYFPTPTPTTNSLYNIQFTNTSTTQVSCVLCTFGAGNMLSASVTNTPSQIVAFDQDASGQWSMYGHVIVNNSVQYYGMQLKNGAGNVVGGITGCTGNGDLGVLALAYNNVTGVNLVGSASGCGSSYINAPLTTYSILTKSNGRIYSTGATSDTLFAGAASTFESNNTSSSAFTLTLAAPTGDGERRRVCFKAVTGTITYSVTAPATATFGLPTTVAAGQCIEMIYNSASGTPTNAPATTWLAY